MKITNTYNGIIGFVRRSAMMALCVAVASAMLVAAPTAVFADSGSDTTEATQADTAAEQQKAPAEAAAKAPAYKAKAKADGKSQIKVSWSKVDGASGYVVYRSNKASKRGKKVYSTNNASKKSWKDKKALVGKKYYYTVKAISKEDGKTSTVAVIKTKKVKNTLKYTESFTAKTYAYSGGGTTASGKPAKVGRVAVDPSVIELGTWLYIEGYGLCQAADTGGSIKGNKIDLYMSSFDECYDWGVRDKTVYILD